MKEDLGYPLSGEDQGREVENVEQVADVLDSVSKPEKIFVFLELARNESLPGIKERSPVSGSTVHNYVDDLHSVGLIDKREDYKVTKLGREVLFLLFYLGEVKEAVNREEVLEDQAFDDEARLSMLDEAFETVFDEEFAELYADRLG